MTSEISLASVLPENLVTSAYPFIVPIKDTSNLLFSTYQESINNLHSHNIGKEY